MIHDRHATILQQPLDRLFCLFELEQGQISLRAIQQDFT